MKNALCVLFLIFTSQVFSGDRAQAKKLWQQQNFHAAIDTLLISAKMGDRKSQSLLTQWYYQQHLSQPDNPHWPQQAYLWSQVLGEDNQQAQSIYKHVRAVVKNKLALKQQLKTLKQQVSLSYFTENFLPKFYTELDWPRVNQAPKPELLKKLPKGWALLLLDVDGFGQVHRIQTLTTSEELKNELVNLKNHLHIPPEQPSFSFRYDMAYLFMSEELQDDIKQQKTRQRSVQEFRSMVDVLTQQAQDGDNQAQLALHLLALYQLVDVTLAPDFISLLRNQNSASQFLLSECFREGIACEPNPTLADFWRKQAQKNQHQGANLKAQLNSQNVSKRADGLPLANYSNSSAAFIYLANQNSVLLSEQKQFAKIAYVAAQTYPSYLGFQLLNAALWQPFDHDLANNYRDKTFAYGKKLGFTADSLHQLITRD